VETTISERRRLEGWAFERDLAASAICRARFFGMPVSGSIVVGHLELVEAGLAVLLFLDPGKDLAQALVLDNCGMIDALQLVEGGVRHGPAFPANLQPSVRKVIDLDHFATKANRQAFRLKSRLEQRVTPRSPATRLLFERDASAPSASNAHIAIFRWKRPSA
jgi:hypothetical protein